MFRFKKGRVRRVACTLWLGLLFSPLVTAGHLIRIDKTIPFPATVAPSSTTTAIYTIVNTSPNIPLQGIEDQSTLSSGMTILNTSTCSANTVLPVGGSCTIVLRLVAPATTSTLTATLKEHPLPSADGVKLPITVSVGGISTPDTVPSAPKNVVATGGNASATISWSAPTPPTNYIGPAVTSYTVTSTVGSHTCIPSPATATTCTVEGLNNDMTYTFTVSATNSIGTGPLGYSSPVTPRAVLSASPSNLALSGLGSGASRTITVRNNSANPVTLSGSITPSPALPTGTSIASNTCTNTTLAANGTCTITIQPGSTVSSGIGPALCTTGIAPTPSVLSVTDGSDTVNINVVVLGYACQYQSGYVFAIDDTTPLTSSMGGKVAATTDKTASYWSPNSSLISIWGIDDASTVASPSPNASSAQPATLTVGQLNCDAINDGACATNNLAIFYSLVTPPSTNYAFSQCKQSISGLTDWYLPSTCELGPFGTTGESGNYPYNVSSPACISTTMNIQTQLAAKSIGNTGNYWSSTELSVSPQFGAWFQNLASSGGGNQGDVNKDNFQFGVRCVRALTL